jgi:uncharacterized protein (DUF885 family)
MRRDGPKSEAVQYFLANSATTEAQARSEVPPLPGAARPGHELQDWHAEDSGDCAARPRPRSALCFDIRAFHDTVLGGGALPLTVLEKRVDGWIAQRK